jgi:hypothetical protein
MNFHAEPGASRDELEAVAERALHAVHAAHVAGEVADVAVLFEEDRTNTNNKNDDANDDNDNNDANTNDNETTTTMTTSLCVPIVSNFLVCFESTRKASLPATKMSKWGFLPERFPPTTSAGKRGCVSPVDACDQRLPNGSGSP